ncbi:MAG: phosphoribosylformylglycinamidine synthase subunit PurL [Anaerolineae bacterium]
MTTPNVFRIDVALRGPSDAAGRRLLGQAHHLGLVGVTGCAVGHIYFLQGALTLGDALRLAETLLADPVTETAAVAPLTAALAPPPPALGAAPDGCHTIEVTLLPGVTDAPAESLLEAARRLGVPLDAAATGQRYELAGRLDDAALHRLATDVLTNAVIGRYAVDAPIAPPFVPTQGADETVEIIRLRDADDAALLAISAARRLALDLAEMRAIRAYFEGIGRDPTDAELETLAQTWSEHCVHKTFKAAIDYLGPLPGLDTRARVPQRIDGLLATTIRAATERLARPWVRSAFVDNAGVIALDDTWDVAFKVETHNHPSALEPFGGANTGVGGVVRDILGVSARPIANTDVLCFGPEDLPAADLPPGVLHPRRVAEGVAHGVEDYGNKMGIPTVNGAILYHPGYTANPLVFCGCLGLVPQGAHRTGAQAGDLIVVIGGRTGRDGLRGATFSSMAMDQTTAEVAGSAVQIGHPIHEKGAQEVILQARDERLYNAITDCGAGGLSSAVGEMGERLGARVQLADVPLKYPGLRPWEIWLSEAQERMVLAVPAENWPRVQAICAGYDVAAVCIGVFEPTGHLRLVYGERPVGDLAMDFLHHGIPRRHLTATWAPPALPAPRHAPSADLRADFLALLAHPNIRSRESVIRRYDHEVQGATAVKPLVGVASHGPSDAAVLLPLETLQTAAPDTGGRRGLALSAGICPAYGELDPYIMAWAAIDEAIRNAVAVGADPDQIALLDNFCWGDPQLPDRLGALVRCAQGCYDAATAYGAPFISGKDSLNNEYTGADGQRHAIPGTLLISAVGIAPDVACATTMDLKTPGNLLYLVGETRAELGGSHYAEMRGSMGGALPRPVPEALERWRAVHRAMRAGLVQACHDPSEGGLGVAVAEMCLAGQLGAEIDLAAVPGAADIASDDAVLFAESLSRLVVEVAPSDAAAFDRLLADVPCACIGTVRETPRLVVCRVAGNDALAVEVAELEAAWRGEDAAVAPTSVGLPGEDTGVAPTSVGLLGEDEVSESRLKSALQGTVGLTRPPRALVLHANGTNRDHEAAHAVEMAGGVAEIVHVNQLLGGEKRLADYGLLILPGGFSYGDDLGAGTLWALDVGQRLGDALADFVAAGRPVLGICNGFQALVKAGLLDEAGAARRAVTLTANASGHFECRWVYLRPNPAGPCVFTEGLDELIYCPVAHGEGRVVARDDAALTSLVARGLAPLTYVDADGAAGGYPVNPNGSALNIAGLCNAAGNVFGLMPHPEDHIFDWQHPRWRRGERGQRGLRLFENAIKYARR